MKFNRILFFTFTILGTRTFSAERPSQPPKRGALDVLPAELRLEQVKAIASPPLTLKEAVANIKTYYIAHPPSQQSLDITKAILTHLMHAYSLDSNELQAIIDQLAKRETMTVFQNDEMKQWIKQQKDRLDKEEELGRATYRGDIKKIKELLAQGVNVNVMLGHRGTPIDILFTMYIDLNDPEKLTKFNDLITALLNAGANPNGSAGFPLREAVSRGLPSTVKLLLQAGADPNINPFTTQGSALATAAFSLITQIKGVHEERQETFVPEYTEIIKMLLAAGAKRDMPGIFRHDINYATIKDLINSLQEFTPEEKAEAIAIIYG